MRDPYAPLVAALTHSGFKMAKPVPRKQWESHLAGPIEAIYSSKDIDIQSALQALEPVTEELERLEEAGVWALTLYEKRYPDAWRNRLGIKGPPIIFGIGSQELNNPSVAILGSRNASEPALGFAQEVAREAIRRGYSVVSGGAKGADLAAIHAGCSVGGQAVVVAADSISSIQARLVRAGCDPGQFVVITSNHPDSGFSVGQAMGRNKLIYSLAEVAVIAACEKGSGGTWTGAAEAIKAGWCPIGVWTGSGAPEGNWALAQAGATAVLVSEAIFALEIGSAQSSLF